VANIHCPEEAHRVRRYKRYAWGPQAANLPFALTFLSLVHGIGKAPTFWLYGGITVVARLFAFFKAPETKGKTFEPIEAYWRSGKHTQGDCPSVLSA
jgi:hypothetical protein